METESVQESSKQRMDPCWSCGTVARYRCPRCAKCSCSVQCANKHKVLPESPCSGQRDPTVFVPATGFGYGQLMNDLTYLEKVNRFRLEAERSIAAQHLAVPQIGAQHKSKQERKLSHLQYQMARHNLKATFMAEGMTRRKLNQTRWHPKESHLLLTVEISCPTLTPPVNIIMHNLKPSEAMTDLLQSPQLHAENDGVPGLLESNLICMIASPKEPKHIYRFDAEEISSGTLSDILEDVPFIEWPILELWPADVLESKIKSGDLTVIPPYTAPSGRIPFISKPTFATGANSVTRNIDTWIPSRDEETPCLFLLHCNYRLSLDLVSASEDDSSSEDESSSSSNVSISDSDDSETETS